MESDKNAEKPDPFVLDSVFPDPEKTLSSHPPTLATLAKDCVFVLDTNSLLTPFDVGSTAFEDVASIYRGLCETDRLFVPRHVLREFCKNRASKIRDIHSHLYGLLSKLPTTHDIGSPMLEVTPQYQALQTCLTSLRANAKEYKARLQDLLAVVEDWNWTDPLSKLYADLFVDGRVINHGLTNEKLLEDVSRRRTRLLPPGYKDKTKEDLGIGDVVIWHTILTLGKDRNTHVVFVSNDKKADWTVKSNDVVLAARPELTEEFHRATGKHFHIATFSTFLALLDAKEETVGRVRSLEEGRFLRLRERLLLILDQLNTICFDFTIEDGSREEYHFIHDPRLYGLAATFRTLWPDLCAMEGVASSCATIFEELDGILSEIRSVNGQLEYMQARMKDIGDEETRRLNDLCGRFCDTADLLKRQLAAPEQPWQER